MSHLIRTLLLLCGGLYLGASAGALAATWRVLEGATELRVQCAPVPIDHPCAADITHDGRVSTPDFVALSATFGNTCDYSATPEVSP